MPPSDRLDVLVTMTVEDKRPFYGPASRHGLSPFQSRIPHPSKRTVLEPLFPSLFVTNRVNRHFANGMRRNWTRCEKSMANKIVQHRSWANSGLDSISCWRLFVPTKPLDKHMQSLQTIFWLCTWLQWPKPAKKVHAPTKAYITTPGYQSATKCL